MFDFDMVLLPKKFVSNVLASARVYEFPFDGLPMVMEIENEKLISILFDCVPLDKYI